MLHINPQPFLFLRQDQLARLAALCVIHHQPKLATKFRSLLVGLIDQQQAIAITLCTVTDHTEILDPDGGPLINPGNQALEQKLVLLESGILQLQSPDSRQELLLRSAFNVDGAISGFSRGL